MTAFPSRRARRFAAAALGGLALAGCTAGPAGSGPAGSGPAGSGPAGTPSASASRTGGWPAELEAEALALAATPDGLLAVTSGTSRHPPQVHRFDASGVRVARQAAVGNPNGLAIADDGGAWVPAVRHPDMRSGTGVPVLDPVSLQPRTEIDAGVEPLSVAFAAGTAWIGARGRVQVVDRGTGTVIRSLPIAGTAYELVAVPTAGTVAVVLDDGLVSLDARTGRLLARRSLDSAGSLTAVLAGGALWVGWLDGGRTRLGRFDPRTLRPAGTGPLLGERGVALAAAGSVLWVADHSAGTLSCLDPATGRVRGSRAVPNSSALAADARWVYLADGVLVRRVPADC